MESFFAQLFIAVSYVSKDAVVQSLEAPKHRLVTSVGHVREQNFTCSVLSTGPHCQSHDGWRAARGFVCGSTV